MKNKKKLFVAWQTPESRKWTVVGVLERLDDVYKFSYTHGSCSLQNFERFGTMNKDVSRSRELFPFFTNRLLNENRPEYKDFLDWMGSSKENTDPLEMLALTEGKRGTDTIELFACPVPIADQFHVKFFAHGVRHTSSANQKALLVTQEKAPIYLALDIQNQFDPQAIILRTADPVCILGYLPRYLTDDIKKLLSLVELSEVKTSVIKINENAPLSYRFLCEIEAPWPSGFEPCSGEEYKPIS